PMSPVVILRRPPPSTLFPYTTLFRSYSRVDSPAMLARRYRELLQVVGSVELLAGFCYTQFADTYQEANGLLYADRAPKLPHRGRSEEHTSELQSRRDLVCRLLLEKKK